MRPENEIATGGPQSGQVLGERLPPGAGPGQDVTQVLAARERFRLTGEGMTCAVIDTGIEPAHAAFKDTIVAAVSFVEAGGQLRDAKDYDGHGSHVAAIIAGAGQPVRGIAPLADIVSLKVYERGIGEASFWLRALDWVKLNHRIFGVTCVNMSLGFSGGAFRSDEPGVGAEPGDRDVTRIAPFPSDEIMVGVRERIFELNELGIAVVAAAGNQYCAVGAQAMNALAILSPTISVGAVFDRSAMSAPEWAQAYAVQQCGPFQPGQTAPFSQRLHESVGRGAHFTTIFAPGTFTVSAGLGGPNALERRSGTSHAAPHVSAIVLMMQQAHWRRFGVLPNAPALKDILRRTGDPFTDGPAPGLAVPPTGKNFLRANALKAIAYIEGLDRPLPPPQPRPELGPAASPQRDLAGRVRMPAATARPSQEIPPDAPVVVRRAPHLLIGAERARAGAGVSGAGLTIAVIDTGIRPDHDDFRGRIAAMKSFPAQAGGLEPAMIDIDGHGSHVAGIIVGQGAMAGVAPNARVAALRVAEGRSALTLRAVREALQWVKANAAALNIRVVNMSLTPENRCFTSEADATVNLDTIDEPEAERIIALINELAAAGIISVAAAGNDYRTFNPDPAAPAKQGMGFPAIAANALSVGAVFAPETDEDRGGKLFPRYAAAQTQSCATDQIAPFSMRLHDSAAEKPAYATDVFAPGSPIAATGQAPRGTAIREGTSQAAPFVAGVVLLMQEAYYGRAGRYPSLEEVRAALRAGSDPVVDRRDAPDNVAKTGQTFRRLNAPKAIAALLQAAGIADAPVRHRIAGAGTPPPSAQPAPQPPPPQQPPPQAATPPPPPQAGWVTAALGAMFGKKKS
jgi:subtilisin family serine protease